MSVDELVVGVAGRRWASLVGSGIVGGVDVCCLWPTEGSGAGSWRVSCSGAVLGPIGERVFGIQCGIGYPGGTINFGIFGDPGGSLNNGVIGCPGGTINSASLETQSSGVALASGKASGKVSALYLSQPPSLSSLASIRHNAS